MYKESRKMVLMGLSARQKQRMDCGQRRQERADGRESSIGTYTAMCQTHGWWEAALDRREHSAGPRDDPEGRDGGLAGRLERVRTYMYLQLVHTVIQQKLTQYYKAIIFQLKIK